MNAYEKDRGNVFVRTYMCTLSVSFTFHKQVEVKGGNS